MAIPEHPTPWQLREREIEAAAEQLLAEGAEFDAHLTEIIDYARGYEGGLLLDDLNVSDEAVRYARERLIPDAITVVDAYIGDVYRRLVGATIQGTSVDQHLVISTACRARMQHLESDPDFVILMALFISKCDYLNYREPVQDTGITGVSRWEDALLRDAEAILLMRLFHGSSERAD